jgi:hypothetical protein
MKSQGQFLLSLAAGLFLILFLKRFMEGFENAVVCPKGYFCPTGTQGSTQFPCPGGKYNSQLGRTSISSCFTCRAGCLCDPGSVDDCPRGCPAGSYCPAGTIQPITCPPGNFCPRGASSPTPCREGIYCPAGTSTQNT